MTFDHLDDPVPFKPDAELLAATKRRGSRLRGRRQVVLGATSTIVVLLAVVVGFGAYERNKASNIDRLDLTASLDDPHTGSSAADGGAADDPPTDVINVLVVGSDARMPGPDRPADENLTDTMMIVRVDPPAHQVRVLSLPRDLWVAIPGHGNEKLNAAWATGGPALLVDTIKANFQIPIHHYLGVDGAGFRQLVDQAGGTDVFAAGKLHDANTGFAVAGQGCTHLDGTATLALVRSRHLTFTTGTGASYEDITSDLGRIQRQQLVARILASAMLERAPTPAATNQLLDTLVAGAILDSTWALKDMARLMNWARGLDLEHDLVMSTPPTSAGYEGKAAVLHLDAADAKAVFDPFRGVTPATTTTLPGAPAGSAAPATTAAPTTTAAASPRAPGVPPAEQWITATQPDGSRCA